MKYNNEGIRRKDRLMGEKRAIELLSSSEYGIMSMVDENDQPYGIPLNFVWDGGACIYIHCSPVGRKMDILRRHDRVSFCIIGNVGLQPSRFTTEYESVVIYGKAAIVYNDNERMEAI